MNVEELISSSKPFDFIHYLKMSLASSLGKCSNVADGDEFNGSTCLACLSHPEWNTHYLRTMSDNVTNHQ